MGLCWEGDDVPKYEKKVDTLLHRAVKISITLPKITKEQKQTIYKRKTTPLIKKCSTSIMLKGQLESLFSLLLKLSKCFIL